MKKTICGIELKNVMIKAIDLLCNTVGDTLGPSGNNVIIDGDLTPYITNDGVTIAKEISSEDKKINCILEIAKEAALKTNEQVGDGTTTTLVLLQSIFKEGLKIIENGYNAIKLKEELNSSLDKILYKIDELKALPTKDDIKNIATISVGNKKDGDFISNIFFKTKTSNSILLEESKTNLTYYEEKKGYNLIIDDIPSVYFENQDEIVINNACILLLDGYLDDLEKISDAINEACERNKNIVIFVDECDDNIKNNLIVYQLQNKNIYLFKLPDYGSRKEAIKKDIASLVNSTIKNIDYETINFDDIGKVEKLIINKKEVIFLTKNKTIKRINELTSELECAENDYEKEFIKNRLSKLKSGVVTIYVGGATKTEIKERIMRYEDALCAIDIANQGIIVGEGISYLKASICLDGDAGDKILRKALEAPFRKIIENIGMEYKIVKDEITKNNFNVIYNPLTKNYEPVKDTTIVDPILVVKKALINAVSIASMLLTTNYLVINEKDFE